MGLGELFLESLVLQENIHDLLLGEVGVGGAGGVLEELLVLESEVLQVLVLGLYGLDVQVGLFQDGDQAVDYPRAELGVLQVLQEYLSLGPVALKVTGLLRGSG